MLFRDELKSVLEKSCKQKQSLRKSGRRVSYEPERETPAITLPSPLRTPLDIQATSFFFQNFVPDKSTFSSGSFGYLEELFRREKMDAAVVDAILAVGYVGLSNFWKDPRFLDVAAKNYMAALKGIRSRLGGVDSARSDQTFVGVRILGVYEVRWADFEPPEESLMTF
jgi:hypothetical protein